MINNGLIPYTHATFNVHLLNFEIKYFDVNYTYTIFMYVCVQCLVVVFRHLTRGRGRGVYIFTFNRVFSRAVKREQPFVKKKKKLKKYSPTLESN